MKATPSPTQTVVNHTPESWSVEIEDGKLYIESHYGTLARVAPCGDVFDTEDEANARLMATAPDLLAALKPFAAYACDPPCGCHNCAARAAIDKAERRAQ